MMSLIGWLLGSSAVPAGPLVFVSGGMGTAIVLTVLLLAMLGVLAWHHEPASDRTKPRKPNDLPHPDSRLPNAA